MAESEVRESRLIVRLPRLGRTLDQVTGYSLDTGYLTSTDGWEVTVYDEDPAALAALELEPVEIQVDEAPQLIGRVEQSQVGGNGTAWTLQGRDYLADLVECHVDPALRLDAGMTLGDAILKSARPCGIEFVASASEILMQDIRTGRNVATGAKGQSFTAEKLGSYKPRGEGIFEFCSRLAARHGATLQPADRRDWVMLGAPLYEQTPAYRIRRSVVGATAGNNVVSATASRDFSSVPSWVLFTGRAGGGGKSLVGAGVEFGFARFADALGGALAMALVERLASTRIKPGEPGDSALLYRLLYQPDSDSRSRAEVERAAVRALAERLKDTLRYEVTLRGHADPESGAVYAVDTIVDVKDEVCQVFEPLWIAQRRFEYSRDAGQTTRLVCWRPGSFQIGG